MFITFINLLAHWGKWQKSSYHTSNADPMCAFKWQLLNVHCTNCLNLGNFISLLVNGSLFILREQFSQVCPEGRWQNVRDFAASVKMEVASQEKRENTTIIAGPGPQWHSVWLFSVPKSIEPVSLIRWCNNPHPLICSEIYTWDMSLM